MVYAQLAASKSHPTADDLFRGLTEGGGGLSRATVYNSLETLVEAGMARRMVFSEGPARYDADVSEHVHLTTPDGRVMDVPEDLSDRILDRMPEDLVEELERRTGMKIERISLQLQVESRRS